MEVQYLEEPTSDYLRAAVNTVLSIHDEVLLLSGHLRAFINSFFCHYKSTFAVEASWVDAVQDALLLAS